MTLRHTLQACIFPFAAVLCGPAIGAAQQGGKDPAASITIAELREHVTYLASDELEGRYLGSRGYELAAEYCAAEFAAAGLEPLGTDGEGNPTFLQAVPILRRRIGEEITLILDTPDSRRTLAHRTDVVWTRGELYPDPQVPRRMVFAGYGIEQPEHGWNDLEGLDLAGKIAVLLVGAPQRRGKPLLPEDVHDRYDGVPGLYEKMRDMADEGAAGYLVIADEDILPGWDQISTAFARNTEIYGGTETVVWDPPFMIIKPEAARAMFARQIFDPLAIRGINLRRYRTFEFEDVTLTVSAEITDQPEESWNVVGCLEGTHPVLKNRYLVLMAHLDHLEPQDGQIMNGADDNASGCTGVLEIAEALAMDPPQRSVIFILFTGEEYGMLGSRHFLNACPVPVDSLEAAVNLDMIGRAERDPANDRSHYAYNSGTINPELTEILQEVNVRTVNWPLKLEDGITADLSDDMWFRRIGIPAVFFFSGYHRDLHRPSDDVELLDFERMQAISRLVYHLIRELGNRPGFIRRFEQGTGRGSLISYAGNNMQACPYCMCDLSHINTEALECDVCCVTEHWYSASHFWCRFP